MGIIDGLISAGGIAGKIIGKAAWEGAKIGGKAAKIMGKGGAEIVKETVKGAAKGIGSLTKL